MEDIGDVFPFVLFRLCDQIAYILLLVVTNWMLYHRAVTVKPGKGREGRGEPSEGGGEDVLVQEEGSICS